MNLSLYHEVQITKSSFACFFTQDCVDLCHLSVYGDEHTFVVSDVEHVTGHWTLSVVTVPARFNGMDLTR